MSNSNFILENKREPFASLFNQGLILGPDGSKMSKSKGNVINPDDVISEYGADCLRIYEMFMGPLSENKPWSTSSIKGAYRFLEKVWNLIEQTSTNSGKTGRNKLAEIPLNNLVAAIDEKITNFQFNTCISDFMKFLNDFGSDLYQDDLKIFLKLLFPFAPIISAEGIERLGEAEFMNRYHNYEAVWPEFNPKLIQKAVSKVKIMIQNKFRGEIESVETDSKDEVLVKIKANEVLAKWLPEEIQKIVYVPGKVINII